MNLSERLKQVRCDSCADRRIIGPEEMLDRLRAAGKLRRDATPDAELVEELFRQHLKSQTCSNCTTGSLSLSKWDTAPDDWDDSIRCEICKTTIPPERLEIFPNIKRCAACNDKPADPDIPEYCDACGGLMMMRQRGGSGLAGYVMSCSDCGRKG